MKRWQELSYRWLVCLLSILLIFLAEIITIPVVFADVSIPETDSVSNNIQVENLSPLLGQSLDADDISAEKIGQFIQAYLQVLQLIEQRENELQGAELEPESQQIQREIEAQALDLIQASGLTLQEYLQLLSLTNIDPEFGERVASQLQEAAY